MSSPMNVAIGKHATATTQPMVSLSHHERARLGMAPWRPKHPRVYRLGQLLMLWGGGGR